MINTHTEREAVHKAALVFNEFGWFFNELTVADFGIDAIVEMGTDKGPNGCLVALQIKGGKSNFSRTKNGITFYFSNTHKEYWTNYHLPVFIILYDPESNDIYCFQINSQTIKQTKAKWKIEIPLTHSLKTLKSYIQDIGEMHKETLSNKNSHFYNNHLTKNKRSALVRFEYDKDKGCTCQIFFENEKIEIEIGYSPSKPWNYSNNNLDWEDPFYYTLMGLKDLLLKNSNTKENLFTLASEIETTIKEGGIYKLSEFLFNSKNQNNSTPAFNEFIKAFELYCGLSKNQYQAITIGRVINFHTEKGTFEIESWAGKVDFLRYLVSEKKYDDIYSETNHSAWALTYEEIHSIEKHIFIPLLLKEWETFWIQEHKIFNKYNRDIIHFEERKEESQRQFFLFCENYDSAPNIIEFAFSIDEFILFPLVLITMVEIDEYNCFTEYCEFEFNYFSWESVCLDDENEKAPTFYIRELDY